MIAGLSYQENYISAAEESMLLSMVDYSPWLTTFQRRVQQYGYQYDYKRRTVTEDLYLGPLPAWLSPLADRLWDEGKIGERPDQVIINEYEPGQGIAAHIDCEPCFGDTIISLTLGAGCVMDFKRGERQESLYLEGGSLLVMRGAARYEWTHGIPGRKSDVWCGQKIPRGRRVSLTFRKVVLMP